MLSSRCALPALALCVLLEEVSAFLVPLRARRDVWQDSDLSLPLPESSDPEFLWPLVAEDTTSERGGRHARPSPFNAPLERISGRHGAPARKSKNKRKRITAPLDTIGSSLFSNHRSRKENPEDWEYYTD